MNGKEKNIYAKNESKSSYFIIYDWMIQELHLKGSELLIYAIIYSYCESGNKAFNGSLSLLSKKSGIDRRNVIATLQRLISKGYLFKASATLRGIDIPIYGVVTKHHHQCQSITTSDETSPTMMKHHQPVMKHHQPVMKHHQPVMKHHQPVMKHHPRLKILRKKRSSYINITLSLRKKARRESKMSLLLSTETTQKRIRNRKDKPSMTS